MNETTGELRELLALADQVVRWTTQGTLRPGAAGLKHLIAARQEYFRRKIDIAVLHDEPLTTAQTGGCICFRGKRHEIRDDCMYHYAARQQPWNHRIPWNCPSYYDGCNCQGGNP
jgi:hypothetical protein